MTLSFRAVTKISSCQVGVISWQGIKLLESPFAFFPPLSPLEVKSGIMLMVGKENPWSPALSDSLDITGKYL